MRALVLKNTPAEGPGTIENGLNALGVPFDTVELLNGQKPSDAAQYSHVIMMGGPMGVYEMNQYPHLVAGAKILEEFIKAGKPALGVCLGAQMLAHALGARVYPGGRKEIGWYEVQMTAEGAKDPVFGALKVNDKPVAQVFQWHGDTFDLPDGAVRLASSEIYQNQAFRFGNGVYALQFHIEVTPAMIRDWLKDDKELMLETRKIFSFSDEVYPAYSKRAAEFYKGFFKAG
ncbi:MAG: hypothetical protein M0Z52_12525 [Actinomycetota bacterium]|nr:hypothetical protein [Actinomycetota bacterium]